MSDLYERQDIVHLAPLRRVAISRNGKSILVRPVGAPEDDAGAWLPLSQVHATNLTANGDEGHVEIPFWLCEDRGLENYIVDPDDPNDAPAAQDSTDSSSSASSDDERPPF